MSISIVSKAMEEADKRKDAFIEKEKNFIAYFAYRTNDEEQVKTLIDRLAAYEKGEARNSVIAEFKARLHSRAEIICRLEELLVIAERYRLEEKKAINQIAELLDFYGISDRDNIIDNTFVEMGNFAKSI